jgi:hypothetical protein
VHIVTRDRALLERFIALGFVAGLEPQRPALGGMHDLTTLLLQGFGRWTDVALGVEPKSNHASQAAMQTERAFLDRRDPPTLAPAAVRDSTPTTSVPSRSSRRGEGRR